MAGARQGLAEAQRASLITTMNDYMKLARADWANAQSLVIVLIVLMFIDVVMGVLCAFSTKTLSSSASRKGMTKKVATLLVVAMAAAIDPFATNIPLAMLVAIFYLVTEALSIVENAGRLGLPVPKVLLETLSKLKADTAPTQTSETQPHA